MANVAVIGAQWGDEGKGKVVDWLASRADIVVRFQGGHNAGHTLVVGDQTYKLSLLPSGVVRGKLGIIGNGVVLDPEALLAEIARVTAQGLSVTPENLRIADNVPLILPLHPSRGLMVSPTERWSACEMVGEVLVSVEETLPRGLRPMHLKTSSPKLGPSVPPEERG